MCEAFHQSNGNGICESGEGCPYIDYNGDEVKSSIFHKLRMNYTRNGDICKRNANIW